MFKGIWGQNLTSMESNFKLLIIEKYITQLPVKGMRATSEDSFDCFKKQKLFGCHLQTTPKAMFHNEKFEKTLSKICHEVNNTNEYKRE